MTVPITGPFTKTITMKGPPNSFGFKPDHLSIFRRWYRQKKPYNLPLAYELGQDRIFGYQSFDPTTYEEISTGIWADFQSATLGERAYNKAWSKFADKVHGEQAQLAVTWLERQKTFDMMASHLVRLRRFVRNVRHFQWDEAAKTMGFNRSKDRKISAPGWRTPSNKAGGAYLEYHFGWEPTIKEVMRCVELLEGDWPSARIHARAREWGKRTEVAGSAFSYHTCDFVTECRRGITAEIRVTNPNLLLADQLGLVNPITTIVEVIPYSFLLDWVVNLSDWIQSFDPFPGVSLVNPYWVSYDTSRQYHMYTLHPSRERWWGERVNVKRNVGSIPGPTLRLRGLKPLSVTRAATAASLLLQQVRRGKAPW